MIPQVGPAAPNEPRLLTPTSKSQDALSEIFARVHDRRDLGLLPQISTSLRHFTYQNDTPAMLALRDVTTIDNEVAKNYQDRMRVAGTILTLEQAVVACLQAKHALRSNFSRNTPLECVKLSNCTLTAELIDGFKQWGSSIKTLNLNSVNLPNGQRTGFGELLSQLSGLKVLIIENSDFNEVLDLTSAPQLVSLQLANCALLQQLPIIPRISWLKNLSIQDCHAITHPPDITHTKQLKNLFLYNLQGMQAAPVIPEENQLEQLFIQECPAITHPPDLINAKHLKRLFLSCLPGLRTTPEIPEENSLEELWVVSCSAITHPPVITHAKQLKILKLSLCDGLLTAPVLPPDNCLKELDLAGCSSLTVAPDMTCAAALQVLDMSSCRSLRTAVVIPRVHALIRVGMMFCSARWPIGWERLPDGVLQN